MPRILASLAAAMLGSCAMVPDPEPSAESCRLKYRVALPLGATEVRAAPALRLDGDALRPFDRAYACVIVTVAANGELQDARVAEAYPREFGEYFLQVVKRGRYIPATTANGEPLATTSVLTATTTRIGGR